MTPTQDEQENPGRSPDSLVDRDPPIIYQPLHNSIPPELVHRFDPVFIKYYNQHNAGRLQIHEIHIEEYRKNPLRYVIAYGRDRGPDIYRITQQSCPVDGGSISIRIFEPVRARDDNGKVKRRGAYVNFHGGGWVFGDLSTDHDFCKRIVHGLKGELVAFDVEYRLAPEHQYPIPVNDCWEAFQWIRTQKVGEFNLDVDKFAVGGTSAGGHLAAVVSHLCRDAGIRLGLQVLCVPVCDVLSVFTPEGEFDRANCPYESYREMEYTQPLPANRMAYFHRQFLGVPRPAPSDQDWRISPIKASNFSGLPRALIFSAEMDPLRDEGELYADKLRAAGMDVELVRVSGAPHTFALLDGILQSGKMYNDKVIERLRSLCM